MPLTGTTTATTTTTTMTMMTTKADDDDDDDDDDGDEGDDNDDERGDNYGDDDDDNDDDADDDDGGTFLSMRSDDVKCTLNAKSINTKKHSKQTYVSFDISRDLIRHMFRQPRKGNTTESRFCKTNRLI